MLFRSSSACSLLLLGLMAALSSRNYGDAWAFSSSSLASSSSIIRLRSTTTTTALFYDKKTQNNADHINEVVYSRRKLFSGLSSAAAVAAMAVFAPHRPASASLLEEFGTDGGTNKSYTTTTTTPTPSQQPPSNVQIDPSLKGSYYYPTAKKRYLPRIQKVTNEISQVPDAILNEDWEYVQEFGKIAENAILPLQLYQSSLDGQGLSMNTEFAKLMKQDAKQYELSYRKFSKSLQQQNVELCLQYVSDMGVYIADYRQQGRLKDDDGNIPSVDEMRRMAMRKPTGQY